MSMIHLNAFDFKTMSDTSYSITQAIPFVDSVVSLGGEKMTVYREQIKRLDDLMNEVVDQKPSGYSPEQFAQFQLIQSAVSQMNNVLSDPQNYHKWEMNNLATTLEGKLEDLAILLGEYRISELEFPVVIKSLHDASHSCRHGEMQETRSTLDMYERAAVNATAERYWHYTIEFLKSKGQGVHLELNEKLPKSFGTHNFVPVLSAACGQTDIAMSPPWTNEQANFGLLYFKHDINRLTHELEDSPLFDHIDVKQALESVESADGNYQVANHYAHKLAQGIERFQKWWALNAPVSLLGTQPVGKVSDSVASLLTSVKDIEAQTEELMAAKQEIQRFADDAGVGVPLDETEHIYDEGDNDWPERVFDVEMKHKVEACIEQHRGAQESYRSEVQDLTYKLSTMLESIEGTSNKAKDAINHYYRTEDKSTPQPS
ncbi:hypothetical protein AB6D11_01005 [Vibrio splendidus]